MARPSDRIIAWSHDPIAFIAEVLVNPETSQPFVLYQAEVEFIRRAFTLKPDGSLRFPEMIYSAPKKSGKTALAAMLAIYVAVVIGGRNGEIYCLSNDFEQSVGRVFEALRRIIEASPLLAGSVKVTASRIEFLSTGSFILACASDYSGFAGANPSLCIFDELWGYVSESAQRLWDESVPSPTRKVSGRLTVSYAGYSSESRLLEDLYKRGTGCDAVAPDLFESPGMLTYWTHVGPAPWQTDAWRQQMRQTLRPNAYLRLVENQWIANESSFVDMADYDACVDSNARLELGGTSASVWVGVDASVRHDSTAIAACCYDTVHRKVHLLWHKIFQPSPSQPLDFEATIERTLRELNSRFHLREIRYDPYQMVSSAQRLTAAGLCMVEYPQSVPNLTAASQNLYDLIHGHNLVAYADADIRLAMSRTTATESPRGWHVTKEKASHKIDIVIALSMAALGASIGGAVKPDYSYITIPMQPRGGIFDSPRPSPYSGGGYYSQGNMWVGDGQALADAAARRNNSVGSFTTRRWNAHYGRGW